jgi:Ca2+-transporting ATPase
MATGVSAAIWALARDAALPYGAIAIFAVVLLNAPRWASFRSRASRAEAAVAALRAMSAADTSVNSWRTTKRARVGGGSR